METLIIKYLSGEASEAEAKTLRDWMALSEENNRQFLDIQKVFDAADGHYHRVATPLPEIDVDQEWSQFKKSVSVQPSAPVIPLRQTEGAAWMKVAAALLVVVASGFLIAWLVTKERDTVWETGESSLAVTLPDSSSVILNKHSRLTYSTSFGLKSRTVLLTGEAYFDVVHDERAPFTVRADNTLIEDIGTAFDVRAYPDGKGVDVLVETGEVRFSIPELNKEISLVAGQSAVYQNESRELTATAVGANALSWKTRKLAFDDMDLRGVVAAINRTYDSNVVIASTVPNTCTITVTFDHQSLEAVLHVLETTLHLTIKRSGDKIEITDAGC